MGNSYYIASCVFTEKFPELSQKIQAYITARHNMPIVRCCFPKYKLREFEEAMPEGALRERWKQLPDSADLQDGDTVYSLCHNCSNIIEEMHPGVHVRSLWELILEDDDFVYPDCASLAATVQDCWRSRERLDEQAAVREILRRMQIDYQEAPHNHAQTDFCGVSLYRPQPERNPRVAPRHYREGARGLFLPHTEQEQTALMQAYGETLPTDTVICYCHYCLEGLLRAGKDGIHLARMLFG